MLYIAVFTLFGIPVAKGFSSMQGAIDCLRVALNDPDSSPLGIYDVTEEIVTDQHHDNYALIHVDEDTIIRLAQSYVERIV